MFVCAWERGKIPSWLKYFGGFYFFPSSEVDFLGIVGTPFLFLAWLWRNAFRCCDDNVQFFLLLKLRSDFGFENKKKNWWINFSHGCQCSTWTTIRFDDPNVGGGSVVEHRSTDSEWLGFKSHWKLGFCLLLLLPITSQDYEIGSATTKESFVFQLYFPHSVHNRFVLHNEATFLLGNKHSCSSCSSLWGLF